MNFLVLAASALLLALLAWVLFIGAVFPLWTLIDCVSSEERSSRSKTLWAVAIFLCLPLGSLAYGIFGARKAWMRRFAIASVALCLLFGAVAMIGNPQEFKSSIKNIYHAEKSR